MNNIHQVRWFSEVEKDVEFRDFQWDFVDRLVPAAEDDDPRNHTKPQEKTVKSIERHYSQQRG